MRDDCSLNPECYNEKDSSQQRYKFFKKIKEKPEIFKEINNQSRKSNLATILVTGTIIAGTVVGAVILGDYFSKK